MATRFVLVLVVLVTLFAGCFSGGKEPDDGAPADPGEGSSTDGPTPTDPIFASMGRWLDPLDGELTAIHAVLLGDGSVVYWTGAAEHGVGGPILTEPSNAESRRAWFAPGNVTMNVPEPADGGASDLFCSGQALLPDGRVLAVGGTRWQSATAGGFAIFGTPDVRTYDPTEGTWTVHEAMAHDRWYPSVLTLPDGRALIASGIRDLNDPTSMVREFEVFNATSNTVKEAPGAASKELPMYPRLYIVPSGPDEGKVFYMPGGCLWCPFGQTPDEASWNLAATYDPASDAWNEQGPSLFPARQAPVSALLPLRPPEYEARLLSAAGTINRATVATNTAEIADLSTSPPTFELAAPLNEGRWFGQHVLLPDGQLFVTGGSRTDGVMLFGGDNNPANYIYSSELFDPTATDPMTGASGAWRTVAEASVPRVYHSTALLLPDARVWVAGSAPIQFGGDATAHHHAEVELYEPPYLFRGPRPTIDAAPPSATWGESFRIETIDASRIDEVVLVRAGSVTHTYNAEQRLIELEIAQADDTGLTVHAPPNAALAPPGAYMLFINAKTPEGPVPSVASMIVLA